jgi:hypothetical protein
MVPERALAQSARQAGLRLLVLFGSRVLGNIHGQSDWDFGYLASGTLDEELLRERLMGILGTDLVDLVDLSKSSALLRIQVAVNGKPVFEAASAMSWPTPTKTWTWPVSTKRPCRGRPTCAPSWRPWRRLRPQESVGGRATTHAKAASPLNADGRYRNTGPEQRSELLRGDRPADEVPLRLVTSVCPKK